MNKYSDILRTKPSKNFFPLIPSSSTIKPLRFASISADLKSPSNTIPDHSGISSLSLLENKKVSLRFLNQALASTKTFFNNDSIKTPDFSKILKNLNLVTNSHLSTEKVLKEGKSQPYKLNKDGILYFKILCKDKKSPLKVCIKLNFGKLKYFVSNKHNKPNEDQYDFSFSDDSFEISNHLMWFNEDHLFLGVFGLADSEFIVTVNFGRIREKFEVMTERVAKTSIFSNFEENDQNFRENLESKVKKLLKARKKKALMLSNSKNFIKINKELKTSTKAETEEENKIRTKYQKFFTEKKNRIKTLNEKNKTNQ